MAQVKGFNIKDKQLAEFKNGKHEKILIAWNIETDGTLTPVSYKFKGNRVEPVNIFKLETDAVSVKPPFLVGSFTSKKNGKLWNQIKKAAEDNDHDPDDIIALTFTPKVYEDTLVLSVWIEFKTAAAINIDGGLFQPSPPAKPDDQ